MDRDYLQEALAKFNTDKPQWYGFRKTDDNGDTIPNDQRMKYEHLILNDDTATMPSESEVNAKIQELKSTNSTFSGVSWTCGSLVFGILHASKGVLSGLLIKSYQLFVK